MKFPPPPLPRKGLIQRPLRPRPFVIVESPYAGDETRNLVYLRRALRDAWNVGELPLASHGYFPFFLHESDPFEREAGIQAGYQLWPLASYVIFYNDYGMSPGMERALDRATHHRLEIRVRSIGKNNSAPIEAKEKSNG